MSMVRKPTKNFTHKRPTPRPVKGLEFKVESKESKDSGTIVYVKDSMGCICGMYDTEENAKKAIPFIKRNLERGFIPFRWLKRHRRNPAQHAH